MQQSATVRRPGCRLTARRTLRLGGLFSLLLPLGFAELAAAAGLILLPETNSQCLFGGGLRHVSTVWRNASDQPVECATELLCYQATSATAAPVSSQPGKLLRFLPGQTLLESHSLTIPSVKAETRFLLQWVSGANRILGTTTVLVYPTNLLGQFKILAGDEPLGVFDPTDQLKPRLRSLAVEFQDLAEDGTDKFAGKLALFGPFASKSQMRASLAADIRALAKRGVAVVWLQPPPPKRAPLKPSFHLVREEGGTVVVAQHSLVERLSENPEAQLNLLRLAELALNPVAFDLPETETTN